MCLIWDLKPALPRVDQAYEAIVIRLNLDSRQFTDLIFGPLKCTLMPEFHDISSIHAEVVHVLLILHEYGIIQVIMVSPLSGCRICVGLGIGFFARDCGLTAAPCGKVCIRLTVSTAHHTTSLPLANLSLQPLGSALMMMTLN